MAEETGLRLTLLETQKTGFCRFKAHISLSQQIKPRSFCSGIIHSGVTLILLNKYNIHPPNIIQVFFVCFDFLLVFICRKIFPYEIQSVIIKIEILFFSIHDFDLI